MATLTIQNVVDFLDGVSDLDFIDHATYEAIGEELLINAQRRFDREVAPNGTKWAPLSKAHARRKRKQDYGDKILHMRGHLRDTLRYQATDTELRFGSDRKYAAIHQFGGRFKAFGKHPAQMPARPYLFNNDGTISDEDRQSIKEVVADAWVTWVARNS